MSRISKTMKKGNVNLIRDLKTLEYCVIIYLRVFFLCPKQKEREIKWTEKNY